MFSVERFPSIFNLQLSQLWIDNYELWIKKTWGLTWGVRWGLTWGVTWGLEKVKSLTQSKLRQKTGGLRKINKTPPESQLF